MDSRDLDTDEVARIYDELLATYEREWDYRGHRSLHLSYYDDDHEEPGSAAMNTMRVLSEAAEITAEDRVLNIGCGAGEDAVWNARAHGAHVIGVNISESQLEMARENAREHDVADLTDFRYDDFHELSTVEDGSVTVVWGLEALSHSPDLDRVFEQVDRVLTPDGRVAFTDLFLTASNPDDVDPETESTTGDGKRRPRGETRLDRRTRDGPRIPRLPGRDGQGADRGGPPMHRAQTHVRPRRRARESPARPRRPWVGDATRGLPCQLGDSSVAL